MEASPVHAFGMAADGTQGFDRGRQRAPRPVVPRSPIGRSRGETCDSAIDTELQFRIAFEIKSFMVF
jgi:hypothetical protein